MILHVLAGKYDTNNVILPAQGVAAVLSITVSSLRASALDSALDADSVMTKLGCLGMLQVCLLGAYLHHPVLAARVFHPTVPSPSQHHPPHLPQVPATLHPSWPSYR